MKAKTKKRFKRTVAFVLCMMMLVSNLLVTSAATWCLHKNSEYYNTFKTTGTYDIGEHEATYTELWQCTDCGSIWTKTRWTVTESHFMIRYTDEGHFGERDHTYRLYCECGFSWLHTIYCSGGSSHAKPW